MRQLETDLILRFHTALHAQFHAGGGAGAERASLVGTALGGQDRALADYLLVANARFALIEFKADAKGIATEADKPLRRPLCHVLAGCRRSAALARDIHYLAWGEHATLPQPGYGMQTVEEIVVTPYAPTVCPLLGEEYPVPAPQAEAAQRFIRRFLVSRTAGGSAPRFKAYLELLYSIAGGRTEEELKRFEGSVYVFVPDAADPSARAVASWRFHGLDHLLELTLGRSPTLERKAERERSRAPERGRGGPAPSR